MQWIDLHLHSTYSDGSMTPAQLIDLAVRRRIAAIALTDHDTVAGVGEFLAYAQEQPVKAMSGIEISSWHGDHSLHILGYGLDHRHPGLLATLAQVQEARHRRNLQIMVKLNELGHDVHYHEIPRRENGQVGRPHIAELLVRKRIVAAPQEAFSRFLRRGGAAYVESFRIHALDAIRLVKAAGGLPVLAHPAVLDSTLALVAKLLPELREAGLAGLEIHYPSHSKKQTRQLSELAARFSLLATGGTDFHGEFRLGGAPLGGNFRTIRVPWSCFAALTRRLTQPAPAATPA